MGKTALVIMLGAALGCAQGVPETELGSAEGQGADAGSQTECACTTGACCDGCNLLPGGTLCGGDQPTAVEYQCDSDSCGGDAMIREQRQVCDGVGGECRAENLVWGDWQVLEDCDGDSLCQSDGQSATCTTCSSGCTAGACTCTQGGNVAPGATPTISRGSSDQSTYGPQNINDGVGESGCGFAWVYDESPDIGWMQLEWSAPVELWGLTVDTVSSSNAPCLYTGSRTLAAAAVEWWDGSAWVIEDSVAGQTTDWTYFFDGPITTTRLRINQMVASPSVNPVVFELQAFECAQ
jgi:hypothetical protein